MTSWAFDNSTWQTHPYHTRYYVYLDAPPAVFAGTVASNFGADAVHYWAYTASVGVAPEVGQTVKLFSADGRLKNVGRVRRPIFAGTLYVDESSLWAPAANDYFVVYDDYRLFSKIPLFTDFGQQRKDTDLIWNGDTSSWRPLAATNGYYVGTVDATGSVQVWLDASDSVANTGSITSYLWECASGSPSTINAVSGTMALPAGRHWISLTVTDSAGNSAQNKMLAAAIDGSTLQWSPARVTRLEYSLTDGANAEIEILDEGVVPDAHHIVMVAGFDYYAGTQQFAGGLAGREHVKLVGYLDEVNSELDYAKSLRRARVISPLLYLKERLVGLSQILEYTATPTDWHQANPLNVWLVLYYLLKYHTTYTEILPIKNNNLAQNYDLLGWTDESLSSQLLNIAQAANLQLTCDRYGRLHITRDWTFAQTGEYSAMLSVGTLDAGDWVDTLNIQRNMPNEVSWLEASGIQATTSTVQPLFAIAAGEVPSQIGLVQRLDRLLPRTQSELNDWAGQKYAYDNRSVRVIEQDIAHLGAPFDPATGVRAVVDVDGTYYDSFLERVTIDFEPNTNATRERYTWQPLPNGISAKTRVYLGDDSDLQYESQLPIGTLPPLEFPPLPEPSAPPEGVLAIAFTDSQTLYSINADNATPAWNTAYGTHTLSVALDEFSDYVANRAGALGIYVLDVNGSIVNFSDVVNNTSSLLADDLQGAYSLRSHRGALGTLSAYGTRQIAGTGYTGDWVYQYNNPDSEGTIVSITEGSLDTAQGNPAPSFAHALINPSFGTPRTSKLEHQLEPSAGTINDVTYINMDVYVSALSQTGDPVP
ncbi:MAG: hypothetical protein D6712_09665, partial [Chloroflexi bacterium]